MRPLGWGCLGWVVGAGLTAPLAVVAGFGAGWWTASAPPPAPAAPAPAAAPPPDEARAPSFLGVVLPIDSVDVVARYDARVGSVLVEMGEAVVRDQPLATLDPLSLSERIDAARAQLAASGSAARQAELSLAEAERTLAELEAVRIAVPGSQIVAADYERQRAESALREARATHAQHRAALAELESALSGGQLVAPIDGVVVARLVSEGATVRTGDPVLQIASGALGVRFAIEQDALGAIAPGDAVSVQVPVTGLELAGQVLRVSPRVDAASGVVLAEASVAIPPEETDRVIAGLSARVTAGDDDGS